MTVKADERQTGGVVSVLEAEEPPGFGPPMHVHHDCAEAFYVLEGEYIMYLEGPEFPCPAGSFIFIPQGAQHGFKAGQGGEPKLNFYIPASMIGYFDDLASAPATRERQRQGSCRDRGLARDGDRRAAIGTVRLALGCLKRRCAYRRRGGIQRRTDRPGERDREGPVPHGVGLCLLT